MTPITWRLSGGLTDEQMTAMFDAALRVLRRTGVACSHARALNLLRGVAGAHVDGDRVRFEAELVKSMVKRAQGNVAGVPTGNGADPRLDIMATGYLQIILDPETGKERPPTCDDLRRICRAAENWGMYGCPSVTPKDVPEAVEEITMAKIAMENSTRIGAGPVSTPQTVRWIREMNEAAHRPSGFGMHAISPLKIDDRELDISFACLDMDPKIPLWAGAMPILGATAPLRIPEAFVMTMAETLAVLTIYGIVAPESPLSFNFDAYPLDMRTTAFVWGSAEHYLIQMTKLQLARFFHVPCALKGLVSMSKRPDAQAAAERMAGTLLAGLAGATRVSTAGHLADEIMSPAQMAIDVEIVRYVERFLKGFAHPEDNLDAAVELIDEIGPGGNYLSHDSTLMSYRDELWDPTLFTHDFLANWHAAGEKDCAARAAEEFKRSSEACAFTLPADRQQALDKVFEAAKKDLS